MREGPRERLFRERLTFFWVRSVIYILVGHSDGFQRQVPLDQGWTPLAGVSGDSLMMGRFSLYFVYCILHISQSFRMHIKDFGGS